MLRVGSYIRSTENIIARYPLPGQLVTFMVHGREQTRTYLFLGPTNQGEALAAVAELGVF
jgi:hypothetical protein